MSAVKTSTKEKIVLLATELIETKGYSGFSYQDISDRLNIKKASIHYHFPAKEDLGLAVFDAFVQGIDDFIKKLDFDRMSPTAKLAEYFRYHAEATLDCNKISCIGAMTSEWNVLPERLRERIDKFNQWHAAFIVDILKEGVKSGEFRPFGSLEEQALFIIASTKGALLMARERKSTELYHAVARQIMGCLKG